MAGCGDGLITFSEGEAAIGPGSTTGGTAIAGVATTGVAGGAC
jgi:hypothetical protein